MSSLFRQLLIAKVQGSEPLPEGDFLLASSSKVLGVSNSTYFNYGITKQLITDTLSGTAGVMPSFEVSFEVHSDLWDTDGSREVLNVPNLLTFYAANKTPYIQLLMLGSISYEIAPTELVTGWNEVRLTCDGTYIRVYINGVRHTMFDCSDYTLIPYYTMSGNGRIHIPAFQLGTGDWEVQMGLAFSAVSQQQYLYGGSSYFNCGIAMEANTSGSIYHIGIGTSTNGSSWASWKWGDTDVSSYVNKHILLKQIYSATDQTVTIGYSFDRGATWVYETPSSFTGTVYQNTSNPLQVGTTANSSSAGFRGKLYIEDFKVTTAAGVIFDGKTAVAGTDYTIVQGSTYGTEEEGTKPLTFGTIGEPSIGQDRTKIKELSLVSTEESAA